MAHVPNSIFKQDPKAMPCCFGQKVPCEFFTHVPKNLGTTISLKIRIQIQTIAPPFAASFASFFQTNVGHKIIRVRSSSSALRTSLCEPQITIIVLLLQHFICYNSEIFYDNNLNNYLYQIKFRILQNINIQDIINDEY